MSKQSFQLESIIRLNVGGQRFDTSLKTLLADRNNELFHVFVAFLENGGTKLPPKDQDGAFFLDRDPDHFRSTLNTLRYLIEFQERQGWGKSTESIHDEDDEKSTKFIGFWARLRKKA